MRLRGGNEGKQVNTVLALLYFFLLPVSQDKMRAGVED